LEPANARRGRVLFVRLSPVPWCGPTSPERACPTFGSAPSWTGLDPESTEAPQRSCQVLRLRRTDLPADAADCRIRIRPSCRLPRRAPTSLGGKQCPIIANNVALNAVSRVGKGGSPATRGGRGGPLSGSGRRSTRSWLDVSARRSLAQLRKAVTGSGRSQTPRRCSGTPRSEPALAGRPRERGGWSR
jgi:hypothetical protein